MTVLMRARNSADTRWITWSANTADYEGVNAPEPILLNSAVLEIIFGASASKVDNDSTVEGTYVSDALEYLSENGGGGGIIGPEFTTDNAVVRWDGTDGYSIKNSVITLNELGGLNLGPDGYIEIGNSVSTTGDVRLNSGGYITGLINGGIDVTGADGLTGGAINILSGSSSEDETNAANISISGGEATGMPEAWPETPPYPSTLLPARGGSVNITGGESSNNAGGVINIIGGTSDNSFVPGINSYWNINLLEQGGVVNIQGGNTTVGTGGNIYLTGGVTEDGAEPCGSVNIHGGNTPSTATDPNIAGGVLISGGDCSGSAAGFGGNVTIDGGFASSGNSGSVTINGGQGLLSGGNVTVQAGHAYTYGTGQGGSTNIYAGRSCGTNNGGNITIEAGEAYNTGDGGSVTIRSGVNNSTGSTGNGGNISIISATSYADNGISGEINITSGNADYVGAIAIQGGNSNLGSGGDITITGGLNNGWDGPGFNGGTITITGGVGSPSENGISGNVILNGGDGSCPHGGSIILNGGVGNIVGGGGDIILSTFNGGIIELNKIEFNDGYFSALNETEIRLYGSDNHYSGFKASATGVSNTWTLPEDDGPDGYVLTTDGSGTLSWSEGGRDPNSHADTHILDGSDELDGYNIAIDYTPTNYTTPVNGIIGEHIAAIDAALSNPAPVDSVFGRTGAITAATDDYSASQIDNNSAVTGEQVSDALEYLDGYVSSVADDVAGISTMAVSGDLSGNLPNPTVTDLTIADEEQGSVLYFNGSNWVQLPPGEEGKVLTTHGTAAPTWEEAASGSGGSGGSSIVVMTTPGTSSVTIPLDATILRVSCGGAGGGGDGGWAQNDSIGGYGGSGGHYSRVTLDAAALRAIAASISVTVGAGGAGGTGGVTQEVGENGGSSSVSISGTLLVQANGGSGGSNESPPEWLGEIIGSFGGIAEYSDGEAPDPNQILRYSITWAGAGGGAGGGSGGDTHLGGDGGLAGPHWSAATPAAGGAAGAAGTAGGATITDGRFAGRGGGGGGGSGSGNGGNGGAGQTPGAGGGGGGGCPTGNTAGNGGDGGDGLVVLEWI